MSKNSNKQILKQLTQISKQKAPVYPYYPVSAKYQQNGDFLLFSVEYPVGVACITYFMIKKDYTRKLGITNIQLAGINDRSAISTFQIIDFNYKENNSNVFALQGTILVGYRQGHLVIIKFKDKKTQIVNKFNKSMKKQGFMSKASSFIGGQQVYKTFMYGPIKSALYSPLKKYAVSFLVGNTLVFYKGKDDVYQDFMQKQYKRLIQSEQQKKIIKIIKNQGIIYKVQHSQICTYNYTQRQKIYIAYSMESIIQCHSSKDFSLVFSIKMEMPIRKFNTYSFIQAQFIVIMPYEDYVIIVDLTKQRFTKIIGHRCFIANSAIYRNQINELVFLSGGMDHRICFDKISDISVWHSMVKSKSSKEIQLKNLNINQSQKTYQINQDKQGIEFSNKYSLGQYQNARTNSHDYGFSDLICGGNNIISFPTYDGKIKVFSIFYK